MSLPIYFKSHDHFFSETSVHSLAFNVKKYRVKIPSYPYSFEASAHFIDHRYLFSHLWCLYSKYSRRRVTFMQHKLYVRGFLEFSFNVHRVLVSTYRRIKFGNFVAITWSHSVNDNNSDGMMKPIKKFIVKIYVRRAMIRVQLYAQRIYYLQTEVIKKISTEKKCRA